jgi:hypothetical protein
VISLLLCVAVAQSAGAAPAVVSGRVVDAATGRPIAGVVVTPAGTAVPPPASPIDTPVLARVLTSGEGRFVIRGLRAGSLVLTAAKGGYSDATYGQRRPAGSTQPIPIRDGDRVNDLEIRMWKHAAITGTIVDDAGEPAIGVRVTAYVRSYVAGRRRFTEVAAGVTDDRGVYRIAGLTPADYAVGIESTQISVPADLMDAFFTGPPLGEPRRTEVANAMNDVGSTIAPSGTEHAMTVAGQAVTLHAGTLDPMPLGANGAIVFPTTFYPAAGTAAQAAVVSLKSGDEHGGVDIQVHAVRAVRVAGTLVGGNTWYTSVRLMPAAADDLVEPLAAAATVTDATGGFTFPAVPPGDYVLKVVRLPRPDAPFEQGTRVTIAPGSGAATVSGNVPTSSEPPAPAAIPADATLCAVMPISVGERSIDNLVVPLVPGPRVTGRVEFDGTIDGPTGSTLAGMRIFLDPADGSRQTDRTLALETGHPDENGEFATYGVPPGRYLVGVGGPPAGWFLKSVTYQGRDISAAAIDLGTKDATGVVITYTDRPSAIAGLVMGSRGPDADAVVLVYPIDQESWSLSGSVPRRMRTARAKPTGEYAVTALPPGDYYVVAVKEDAIGDWQDPALLQALSRVAQQVRVIEGERKAVNLSSAEIR